MIRVCSLMGVVGMICMSGIAFAVPAQPAETGPEREIVAAFEYPGRVIDDDRSVDLNLVLKNNGRKDEVVYLTIQKLPENWQAQIKQNQVRLMFHRHLQPTFGSFCPQEFMSAFGEYLPSQRCVIRDVFYIQDFCHNLLLSTRG